MYCYELHLDNFKGDFVSIFRFFLLPQIPYFQIVVSRPNIVLSGQTINKWKAYLSFQMMYRSQFRKKNTLMIGFVVQGHMCFIQYVS